MHARRKRAGMVVAAVAVLFVAHTARAQVFPADGAWEPLRCGDAPMTDLFQDEPGALAERDIVGNPDAPAGLRAADDNFFYLRLRLDQDPAPGGTLRPFAWGIELDTDGVLSTYEILLIVSGTTGNVAVHGNTVTTLPNDPNDPADVPAAATYPFSQNGRSVVAAGSNYGGAPDYFLDTAIPWSDLIAAGLTRTTPVTVWAASSSNSNSLNGDFACHDGGSGTPGLTDAAGDRTTLDPNRDTDGDGCTDAYEVSIGSDPLNPNDCQAGPPGGAIYEGGGGCTMASHHGHDAAGWMAWLLLSALIVLKKRRQAPPTQPLT